MSNTIRMVAISDTHMQHGSIEVPDGDILIHAGDATFRGTLGEVAIFNDWLSQWPHRHKIFCAGNHDWLFQDEPAVARRTLTAARWVQDELIRIEGLSIYASAWQPYFMGWAFNLNRGEELREKWDLIPDGVDVLVTHTPPFGILDVNGWRGEHTGCQDLLAALPRVKPRVHIFGHIHESYGSELRDGTLYVNASICDGAYRPSRRPVVIELEREGSRWQVLGWRGTAQPGF